ncbi:MAG: hypothetical protein K0U39_09985 [Alphaproteobacteria bacterium]|nr:hypothetical protein [Alphaproteobacteria bacterium]
MGTSTPPKPPTTITVRDSGVAFDTASVNVRAGSDAEYKIVLQGDTIGDLILPINTTLVPGVGINASLASDDDSTETVLDEKGELSLTYSAPAGSAVGSVGSTATVTLLETKNGSPNPDWPADARADTPKVITFNISDPDINFAQAVYDEYEGDISTVTVNLLGGAIGVTSVPIIKKTFYTDPNTAVLEETLAPLIFQDGDTTKDIEPKPLIPNDGTIEKIEYIFDSDTIPANATYKVGNVGKAIVNVLSKEVEFLQPVYDIPPSQASQLVRVKLGSPVKINRDIPVNVTYHYIGGTSSTPAAVTPTPEVTATNDFVDVEYEAGDGGPNVKSVVYSFNTADSAWQSAKFREGDNKTSTITIDAGSVNFASATLPAAKVGDTVVIKVKLLENNTTGNPIVVPLIKTATDTRTNSDTVDYSHFVEIPDNSDEGTLSYTVPANQQGYKINFGFDDDDNDDATYSWPATFTEGTVAPETEFTVSHGTIMFTRNADDVAPAPNGTKEIKINLESSTEYNFEVPVKITTVNNGVSTDTYGKFDVVANAIDATLDVIPNVGDTSITYTLDTVDADDATIDWPARYRKDGTPASIVLTVSADAVNFNQTPFTIREGGTADLKITVAQAQLGDVVVPYKRTVGSSPTEYLSATIIGGDTEVAIPYTALANSANQDVVYVFDNIDNDDGADDATNGNWPALSVGSSIITSTVSIKADGVRFGAVANNGKIRIGGNVDFDVILDSPALEANYELPYSDNGVTKQLTYQKTGALATINTITYVASTDRNDIGQTYTYTLLDGDVNWPVDATVVGSETLTFTLSDPNIDFDTATQTVADGDSITLQLNLPGGAIGATTVPLTRTVTKNDGTTDIQSISVTFADGAISIDPSDPNNSDASYTVPIGNDVANGLAGDVVSVAFAFDTANAAWPATLDATTPDASRILTHTVTVDNGELEFERESDDAAEGASKDIIVGANYNLKGAISIPIKRTEYTGNVAGTPTYVKADVAVNAANGTFSHTPPAVGVTKVEYELDTTSAGYAADNSFPRFPAGFSAGTTNVITINISDSAINFEGSRYLTKTGETINNTDSNDDIRLVLTKALTTALSAPLPIKRTEYTQGGNGSTPIYISVTVPVNETEISLPVETLPAGSHGKYYVYEFDTSHADWPSDFTVGSSTPETTLYVALSSISFEKTPYDVIAGDDIEITIKFDRALNDTSIQVPLKLTTTNGSDVTTTYRTVTPADVNDDFIKFKHQAPAGTNGTTVDYVFDEDDRDDATVDWPVTLFYDGTLTNTRVNIDNKFVNFDVATQNIREGGTAETKLVLAEAQTTAVAIPIVIKETGESDRTVTVTVPANSIESDIITDTILDYTPATGDAGNTFTLEFATDSNGNLTPNPDGMKVGSVTPTKIITATDSRANFEFFSGNVRESMNDVKVKLILNSPAIAVPPATTVTVSANQIFAKGSSDIINTNTTEVVDFVFDPDVNPTEATIDLDVLADSKTGNYIFNFQGITLPDDVRLGLTSTSTFSIQDADVNFKPAPAIVEPNTTETIEIELESPAIAPLLPLPRKITIPLAVTKNGALLSTPQDVDILHGQKTGSFDYSPLPSDAGDVITYSLDATTANWPTDSGVTPGDVLTSITMIVPLGEVKFTDATLDARKGTIPLVKVELTEPAVAVTEIPITVTKAVNGVIVPDTPSDPNPATTKAEFAIGEKIANVVIPAALNDAVDTTYTYEFGTPLPSGVSVDADADNSVVTLTDDAIDFTSSTATIRAGLDTDANIVLVDDAGLDKDGNDGIDLPIIRTFTPKGETLGNGNDVITYISATFNKTDDNVALGDTALASEGGGQLTYTFDTGDAGYNADNTHPQWPAGFTTGTGAGRIDTRTVTVTDSLVAFDLLVRDVDFNVDETITVTLATPHVVGESDIIVPIIRTKVDKGGVPIVAGTDNFDLTFTAGAQTQPIIYGDDADEQDVGGTEITYAFDTNSANWPDNVSVSTAANAVNSTTLTIINNIVDFVTPISYDLRKGDSQKLTIELEDPPTQITEIYYTVKRNGTVIPAISGSVTFGQSDVNNGIKIKEIIYDSSADATHVAGDVITYEFNDGDPLWPDGVDAANTVVTIEIKDSDVYFEAGNYDVRRGGTIDMVMKLASPAITKLEILYTVDGSATDALNNPYKAVFDPTDANDPDPDSYTITHTSAKTDTIGDTVAYAITNTLADPLPSGVTVKAANDATRPSASTATIISDEIYFDNSTALTVREGGAISFTVKLAEGADRDGMVVPLNSVLRVDGVADTPRSPVIATFVTKGDKDATVTDTAGVSEMGEIIYSFDEDALNWPNDVRAQGFRAPTKSVAVTDSRVSFEFAEYTIGYGSVQDVNIILASAATEQRDIVVTGAVTNLNNSTATIPETVTFFKGEIKKKFSYDTNAYGVGSTVVYSFTNLGDFPNVKAGAIASTTVNVSRIGVQFDQAIYNTAAGQDTEVKVKLASASNAILRIPIKSGDVVKVVEFAIGETEKTATVATSALLAGDAVSYSFGTLPEEVKADGNISTDINITATEVQFTTPSSSPDIGDPAEFSISLPAVASSEIKIPLSRTTTHANNAINIDELDDVVFAIGEQTKKITDIVPNFSPWLTAEYAFGDLPAGYTVGANATHIVSSGQQSISFAQASYNIATETNISVNIPITLSAAATQAYEVEVSLYANIAGGTSTTTETVNFAVGDITKNVTFTGAATNTVNDVYRYSFSSLPVSLAEGAHDTTDITLVNPVFVNFKQASEGIIAEQPMGFTVILSEPAPAGGVIIDVSVRLVNFYSPNPVPYPAGLPTTVSMSFAAGEKEKSHYFEVPNDPGTSLATVTFVGNNPTNYLSLKINTSALPLPVGYDVGAIDEKRTNFLTGTAYNVQFDGAEDIDIFQNDNSASLKIVLNKVDTSNKKRLTISRSGNVTGDITVEIPANSLEGIYNLTAAEISNLGTTTYSITGVENCDSDDVCVSASDTNRSGNTTKNVTVISPSISFETPIIESTTASNTIIKLQLPFDAPTAYIIPLTREITVNGNTTNETVNVTIPINSNAKSIVVQGADYLGNDAVVKYSLPATLPYGLVLGANNSSQVNIRDTYVSFTQETFDLYVSDTVPQPYFEVERRSATGETTASNVVVSIEHYDLSTNTVVSNNTLVRPVPANGSYSLDTFAVSSLTYEDGDILTITLLPNAGTWTVPDSETPGPITVARATVRDKAAILFDNSNDGYGVAGDSKSVTLTRLGDVANAPAITIPVKVQVDNVDNGTVNATFTAGDGSGTVDVDLTTIAVGKTVTLTLDETVADWNSNYIVGASGGSTEFTTVISSDAVVEFGYQALTVDTNETGNISVTLDRKELDYIAIPVNVVTNDVSEGTSTNVPVSAIFKKDENEKLTYIPYDTTGLENGDTITYTFGTMPPGYVAGDSSKISATLTVLSAANVVSFGTASSPDAFANGSVTIPINLATKAVAGFAIILNIQKTEGSNTTNSPRTFVFEKDDHNNRTFTYDTKDDGAGTDSVITFSFKSLPSYLSEGSQKTHSLTVKDSSVQFSGVPNRDETLEFNSSGTFSVVAATPRSTALNFDLQVTDIDADGDATPGVENITIPAGGTKQITYNKTTLADAGKQRLYRLPNNAATIAPSANKNFDYRFATSSKLFWIETQDTDTIVGNDTIVKFKVLEPVTSSSKFDYTEDSVAGQVTIANGTLGTSVINTSGLNVGDSVVISVDDTLTQHGYHVDPTRKSITITMISAPIQTIKFAQEYSVAEPGDDVTVQWQSTPAYQSSAPATHLSLKRTYVGNGGNEISNVTSQITSYNANGVNDETVAVPSILSGDDVVVELENLPSGYGLVSYQKHTIYTPRSISFDNSIYVGTVGTKKTGMKLRANNSLPYNVNVSVTAVVQDGTANPPTETFDVVFNAGSDEAEFDYDVASDSAHVVEFSFASDAFDDEIVQSDNSNLTATLRPTKVITDVAFVATTSSESYTSISVAGRTIKAPVTLASNTILHDDAAVAIDVDVREAFSNSGTWQAATALLKKEIDGDHYVEYILPETISGDGVLGIRLRANSNMIPAANNIETNMTLSDTASSKIPVTVTFAKVDTSSTFYDVIPFKLTFSQALPYDVDMPMQILYAETSLNAGDSLEQNFTVEMPKNTTEKTFYYTSLDAYAVSATSRGLLVRVTSAYDDMTINGTFFSASLNAYPMDMGLDTTVVASPTDTIQLDLTSVGAAITEHQNGLPPEITLQVSTQIDGGTWSAYEDVTARIALKNPTSWSDGKRTSNNIEVPYTLPQFNNTMKVKFKLETLPGVFIPSDLNDKEVIYTVNKATAVRTLSFDIQDLGADKEFDENVNIKLNVSPVSTISDITVPIIITYTPENSVTPSKTVEEELIIYANSQDNTLTHKTLKYHKHTVRITADVSELSNVVVDANKNYSQYTASANKVNFDVASGSGAYTSNSQLTVKAKTPVAAYSDMIVKSRYRTKFGVAGFGAWQEVETPISQGNTQNGFNLGYNLPAFTADGTIEIELLDNDAGSVVLNEAAATLHKYTGTITHFSGNREVGFVSATLPDIFGGQVYEVPMVVSQAFASDKDIDIKIEYIDRDSDAVLETDNTQSVTFLANEATAKFTQTAPSKNNVWVKITAVPEVGSNIIVNSVSASSTMKLDGHQFAFATDSPVGTHSAGDIISFNLMPSATITDAIPLSVEIQTVSQTNIASAWVAVSPAVEAYGNAVVINYELPSSFTDGTYVVRARVKVGDNAGIYDAADISNSGYIQSNYTAFSSAATSRIISFIDADIDNISPGYAQYISVRANSTSPIPLRIPLVFEYRDKNDGNKLVHTDTSNSVLISATYTDGFFQYAVPYHHNYEITLTANFPADSNVSLDPSNPSTKITTSGYEMALNDATISRNATPSSNISVSGTLSTAILGIAGADMPYRHRTRIYGEAWQEWEYDEIHLDENDTTFTLTATTPAENYAYADIEFEPIDSPKTGFIVSLGNSKTTVNVTNNTVPPIEYELTSTSSESTTFYTGKIVSYKLQFTSAVNKSMLIPMKAVITDRTTNQVLAIDRFTVPHTSGSQHALTYTLPDGDHQYVTISLDLPANNSLFTLKSGTESSVSYILDGYTLKFTSASEVSSTAIPGDSIDVELQRQAGVTYNNIAVIMQRRIQMDDSSWSDWYDFSVDLGTSQSKTFSYVIPNFDSVFNYQTRLKPGGDSGAQWQANNVTTFNYNVINQTIQAGTIRLHHNSPNAFQVDAGTSFQISASLYTENNSSPLNATKDLNLAVEVYGLDSNSTLNEILLITIPAGENTGSVTYTAPFIAHDTFFKFEMAFRNGPTLPLTVAWPESHALKVKGYEMKLADAGSISLTQPGETIATRIVPNRNVVVSDAEISMMRRFKIDDDGWGLWETVSVTMPKGTLGGAVVNAGFDYNWVVPVYNRTLEAQIKLVDTPEKGVVIAADPNIVEAEYKFYKQYWIEFENEQSHADFTYNNFPVTNGTVTIPIKVYGPPNPSPVDVTVANQFRWVNVNRLPGTNYGSKSNASFTIPANTADGSTVNFTFSARNRNGGDGGYYYKFQLSPPTGMAVTNDDSVRQAFTYYPVRVSHGEEQTASVNSHAYNLSTYTMPIYYYNPSANQYTTVFFIPIKLQQKTIAPTYLKYVYKKRWLRVNNTSTAWTSIDASATQTLTIPAQNAGSTVNISLPIDPPVTNTDVYGWEYKIILQANDSNYQLKEPSDLERDYKVNQYPIIQFTSANQNFDDSTCGLSGSLASAQFSTEMQLINGKGADSISLKFTRYSKRYHEPILGVFQHGPATTAQNVSPGFPIGGLRVAGDVFTVNLTIGAGRVGIADIGRQVYRGIRKDAHSSDLRVKNRSGTSTANDIYSDYCTYWP